MSRGRTHRPRRSVDQPFTWLGNGGVRLSDGTLIGVAAYPGCQWRSEFAGF